MVGAQGRALGGAARWASRAAFKLPEGTGQMVLASVAPEGRTAIPRGRTSLRRTPVAPDISRPDLLALDPAGSPLPGDRHANARPDDIDELRVKKEGSEGFPSLPSHHPAQGTNFNRWFLKRQFAACGGHRGWARHGRCSRRRCPSAPRAHPVCHLHDPSRRRGPPGNRLPDLTGPMRRAVGL